MPFKFVTILALSSLTTFALAQQDTPTSVPPEIRALLEQQSRGNPYEQMAQMQVNAQYGELLSLYPPARQPEIRGVLIRVFGQRMQRSAEMTTAAANQSELTRISTADYLREQLADVLTRQELQLFDDFQQGTSERQLRITYGDQLLQAAPEVTEANREIVLDAMVEHMLLERTDINDPQEMITRQLQSLAAVRADLETRLDAAQFREAERFIDRVQTNLYRNRGMYEAMQEQ